MSSTSCSRLGGFSTHFIDPACPLCGFFLWSVLMDLEGCAVPLFYEAGRLSQPPLEEENPARVAGMFVSLLVPLGN